MFALPYPPDFSQLEQVMIEILQQLGYLNKADLAELAEFAPVQTIHNWRKLEVGESRTIFDLEK